MNTDMLIKLCSLFSKRANIETDMAKRIMLSIIPSVMTKDEMHQFGGFDYKALKSAANGAKDLVKFGAKACIGEMEYYRGGYGVASECKDLWEKERFKECCALLTKSFLEKGVWEPGYGGPAWGKISKTLLEIEEKREMLAYIREEGMKNPSQHAMDMEIETLRDIIVLMNVFDGLAHNNGSVMPKVLLEEYKTVSGKPDYYDDNALHEYIKRVKNLMDSKEMDDPMTVYKEIQNIIEMPENKHLFRDWITRIRNAPEYQKAPILKSRKVELALIQSRKAIKARLAQAEQALSNAVALKDKIINTHNEYEKRKLFSSLRSELSDMATVDYDLRDMVHDLRYSPGLQNKSDVAHTGLTKINIAKHLNHYTTQAEYGMHGSGNYYWQNSDLINDMHTLKGLFSRVSTVIDTI